MFSLILGLALATPDAAVLVGASLRDDGAMTPLVGATFGLPGGGRLLGEAIVEAGLGTGGALVGTRLGGSAWLAAPTSGSLGAVASGGLAVDDLGARPLAYLGLGARLPVTERVGLRFDAGLPVSTRGSEGFRFAVGLGPIGAPRGPRPAPPEPSPPEPPPEPPPAPVIATAPPAPDYGPPPAVDPPDATLWIPHPVCAWAPAAEAAALLARYDGDEPVRVQADGFEPAVLGPSGATVVLEPAPPRAEVVVVAWPGDAVRVGDRAVPVNAAGVAVVELAPGPVEVEVRGGGRAARSSTYAPDGHVVWVSLPEPEPHAVYFGSGSGALDARGRAFIAEVAAAAGEARFRLVGWSSPEGNPGANARLSRQRAEVVLEALAAGGVPRERITIVDSVVAGADEPAERARRVDIVAVGPEIP